jgi:hypothetical protein
VLILFFTCESTVESLKTVFSEYLKVYDVNSFDDDERIFSEISSYVRESIPKSKFEVNPLLRQVNNKSKIVSYFLSIIIFTKKPAKSISYFLAFFSSFCVLLIQAVPRFIASFSFSDISAAFAFVSGDSEGENSSKDIDFLVF